MNNTDNFNKIETTSTLQEVMKAGIITSDGISELYKFMQKEKQLKKVCNLGKIKVRSDDGRNYIYINRHQFIGNDKVDLINKLYDHFFKFNLEGLYPDWLIWRRDFDKVSNKTIKENMFLWNTFFKDTEIVKKQITLITATDFIKFFMCLLNK